MWSPGQPGHTWGPGRTAAMAGFQKNPGNPLTPVSTMIKTTTTAPVPTGLGTVCSQPLNRIESKLKRE